MNVYTYYLYFYALYFIILHYLNVLNGTLTCIIYTAIMINIQGRIRNMFKKIIILLIISLSLFLAFSATAFASDKKTTSNSNEKNSKTDAVSFDYEQKLIDFMGYTYFDGKVIMRDENQKILGEVCAVFRVGTGSAEKFSTVQWLAVDNKGNIYRYNVALDEWIILDNKAIMKDCIYLLNQVYRKEFAADYGETIDETKQAVYASKKSYENSDDPVSLIPLNAPVPRGYFADPASLMYMPVYNFSKKSDIFAYLSTYFSMKYLEEIYMSINENFLAFGDDLYLIRDSREYSTTNIDFDSIDYNSVQNNVLIASLLRNGKSFGKAKISFIDEGGRLRLYSNTPIIMYEMDDVSSSMAFVEVPDFEAFISNNHLRTSYQSFVSSKTKMNTYHVTYLGQYNEDLLNYKNLLELLGYKLITEGHENLYTLEKHERDFKVRIHINTSNKNNEVQVEIAKESVGE